MSKVPFMGKIPVAPRGGNQTTIASKEDITAQNANKRATTNYDVFGTKVEIYTESFVKRITKFLLQVLGFLAIPLIFVVYFLFFYKG